MEKVKHCLKMGDFIPALSGLIGKISLVSSFAVVWAQELRITNPHFVFDNIRLELLIGGIIALVVACISPKIAPAGTLAPLVILIPSMVKFGVHPFVLSILVGVIGLIFIRMELLSKLILLSKHVSKTSLTLVFGVSGVLLCVQKLFSFFNEKYLILALLLILLTLCYVYLIKMDKVWMMIPISAVVSLLIAFLGGIKLNLMEPMNPLVLNPIYWWEEVWGIGFGLNFVTILKTLPFAFFVMLLWGMDTVAITTLLEEQSSEEENPEEIDLNKSFMVVAVRNMLAGSLGGAQTGSLWRSFLIPLFMIQRPMRGATFLLGGACILVSLFGSPIKLLAFPPLVWTVLLFGIFMPLSVIGFNKWRRSKQALQKIAIILLAAIGVGYSPIITWLGALIVQHFSKDEEDKISSLF
ncbi:hypothetical protein CS063_12610 [Sporanaerobium hydrogeniformans]|uniref:Uncharacterized protein n=1 Tax=Sporanaerobium hydrogeniformans TaxID=3072179 RepID=A0AC61DB58_9FIRM|nr:DUF3360 family protein [Sporanaerobium hydrogeniformans]PHV69983.1 hypothetical protein CS063_12610 [Sporanaerobium hydrogeniformans]